MSEFKGTKGRWEVDDDGVYSLDPLVLDNIVCLQPDAEFESHKNWKANAQLISKAPEMLEMLGKVLDHLTPEFPESSQELLLDEIKQVIKEATTI